MYHISTVLFFKKDRVTETFCEMIYYPPPLAYILPFSL